MRFKCLSEIKRPLDTLLGALIAETKGVALVETALVTPFLAVVIMGTVDTARYAAAKLEVQQGVNRGLEMSWMGGPTLAATDIQTQAAAQAGVATSAVTVTQTLECSGTATSWSASCTSGQETARYTQIQISTTFTPTFVLGSLARMLGNLAGDVPVSATGAIRIQ
ncbi:MAG TPA: TadE/TadG family type IV pilus assembly protein [Candidatus Polarisedimenticolia bacterium]|jgi:Flp pilus assembly protein TadG|nr:TadE/TadG family type IV pilus assembly protein [Candidatus Polarisedimenticolia bacterium]